MALADVLASRVLRDAEKALLYDQTDMSDCTDGPAVAELPVYVIMSRENLLIHSHH